MHKMVVEITKETQEKWGIKAVKHYSEKENIIELWQKMSDVETQIKHSNIGDVALKRIKKYYGKKNKKRHARRKTKIQSMFWRQNRYWKTGIYSIEKLTRDIIERCRLPEAIELGKKLGYIHDDIMVWEETSIAEKIIKLLPNENIVLNKNFNGVNLV